MDFYNIASLDWSQVTIAGWLGAAVSLAKQTEPELG